MSGYVVYSGKSAYEIAVDRGFVGTEDEWLNSLKGERGEDGKDGTNGEQGQPGLNGLPWVHTPIEYGAKADGITDDSDAFNAAVQAHDYVYVPAGRYLINGHKSIHLRDNVTVEMSDDAVLLLRGESAEEEASADYRVFLIRGCQNVTIKGGKIIGDRLSDSAFSERGKAISMSTDMDNGNRPYKNITIDGLYIEGIKGDGITGYGQISSDEPNLKEVFERDMPGNILIKNTTVTKCYRHGSFFSSGDGITFQNCRYIDNGGRKEDYLEYIKTLQTEEERIAFMGGNSTKRGLLYQLRQYKSTHPLKSIDVRLGKDGAENVSDLEKVHTAEDLWSITEWTRTQTTNSNRESVMRYTAAAFDPSVAYRYADSSTVVVESGITQDRLEKMLKVWDGLTYGSSLDLERHLKYESMHNLVLDNFVSSGSVLGVQLTPAYSATEYEEYKDYGYDWYSLITSLKVSNCSIHDRITLSAAYNYVNGGVYDYLVTSGAKVADVKNATVRKLNIAGSSRPYTHYVNLDNCDICPIDDRVIISCEGGSEKFGRYCDLRISKCTLSTLESEMRPEDALPHGALGSLSLFATQGKINSVRITDSIININCPTGIYIATQQEGNIILSRCDINVNYTTEDKLRPIMTLNGASSWSVTNCNISTDNATYGAKDTNWGFIDMSHSAIANVSGNTYMGDAFTNAIRAYADNDKTIFVANNVFPELRRVCFATGNKVTTVRESGNILIA